MNSTAFTMCWSLDSISVSFFIRTELFKVAEVDAGGEVALGALHRMAEAVELGQSLEDVGLEATTSSSSRPAMRRNESMPSMSNGLAQATRSLPFTISMGSMR